MCFTTGHVFIFEVPTHINAKCIRIITHIHLSVNIILGNMLTVQFSHIDSQQLCPSYITDFTHQIVAIGN